MVLNGCLNAKREETVSFSPSQSPKWLICLNGQHAV
jgi:hypothetical protein